MVIPPVIDKLRIGGQLYIELLIRNRPPLDFITLILQLNHLNLYRSSRRSRSRETNTADPEQEVGHTGPHHNP